MNKSGSFESPEIGSEDRIDKPITLILQPVEYPILDSNQCTFACRAKTLAARKIGCKSRYVIGIKCFYACCHYTNSRSITGVKGSNFLFGFRIAITYSHSTCFKQDLLVSRQSLTLIRRMFLLNELRSQNMRSRFGVIRTQNSKVL